MSLLSWVYNHKEQLNIEFATDNWPSKAGLNLYDYESSIKHKDIDFFGRGVDEIESVAILKSVSEVIERVICNDFDITSVGLSIQSLEDQIFDADVHAKDEVLERYFLKKHIIEGIPFRAIEIQGTKIPEFKKHNTSCKIQLFKMNTPRGYYGVGCLIEEYEKSSVGFSFSYNEVKAIEKAFIEAVPNLFWLQENDISDEEKPFHLQEAFLARVRELLNSTSSNVKFETVLPEIIGERLDLSSHSLFSSAPIRVTSFKVKNDVE